MLWFNFTFSRSCTGKTNAVLALTNIYLSPCVILSRFGSDLNQREDNLPRKFQILSCLPVTCLRSDSNRFQNDSNDTGKYFCYS